MLEARRKEWTQRWLRIRPFHPPHNNTKILS
jgi:hypothetical protein